MLSEQSMFDCQWKWIMGSDLLGIRRKNRKDSNILLEPKEICTVDLCAEVLRSDDICGRRCFVRTLLRAAALVNAWVLSFYFIIYSANAYGAHCMCLAPFNTTESPYQSYAEGSIFIHILQMEKQSQIAEMGSVLRPTCCKAHAPSTVQNAFFTLTLDIKTLSQFSHLKLKQGLMV